jgi:hypothetical protein
MPIGRIAPVGMLTSSDLRTTIAALTERLSQAGSYLHGPTRDVVKCRIRSRGYRRSRENSR